MQEINRLKRNCESAAHPNKKQRTNPTEEKTTQTQLLVFGAGNPVNVDTISHILKQLTPAALERMEAVSKFFYSFIRSKHHGSNVKRHIAGKGYAAYYLRIYLKGNGSFQPIENYCHVIKSTENVAIRRELLKLLNHHKSDILKKIKTSKNLDGFYFFYNKCEEYEIPLTWNNLIECVYELYRTDNWYEYFLCYFNLIHKCKSEFLKSVYLAILSEQIPLICEEVEKLNDFSLSKSVFDNLLNFTHMYDTLQYSTRDRLALFLIRITDTASNDQVHSLQSTSHQGFNQLIENNVLCTYLHLLRQLLNAPFPYDNQALQSFRDFIEIEREGPLSSNQYKLITDYLLQEENFGIFIKRFYLFASLIFKLPDSEFAKLLEKAKSRDDLFYRILNQRFPLEHQSVEKMIFRAILQEGKPSENAWKELKMLSKRPSATQLKLSGNHISLALNLIYAANKPLAFPELIPLITQDKIHEAQLQCIKILQQAKPKEREAAAAQIFNSTKSQIKKIRYLTIWFYAGKVSISTIVTLASEQLDFKNYLMFFSLLIRHNKLYTKQQISTLIDLYDQHLPDQHARDQVYSAHLRRFSSFERNNYLSQKRFKQLQNNLLEYISPKISDEVRIEFTLRYCNSFNLSFGHAYNLVL